MGFKLLVISLLMNTSSSATAISEDDITSKLVPNLWAFITQLLSFLVMVFIVIKIAYKPVHNYVQKRNALVKEKLDTAEKNSTEAIKANQEAQQRLAKTHQEADEILLQAKKQADMNKEKYEADLDKEIRLKKEQAEIDIESKKKQAIAEAQDQIVDIALQASSSLLGREVSSEDNKRYVAQFVKDVSQKEDEKR